jgi:hypothetical protein
VNATKVCPGCKQSLSYSAFRWDKRRDRPQYECRACESMRGAKWHRSPRGRAVHRAYCRTWRQENAHSVRNYDVQRRRSAKALAGDKLRKEVKAGRIRKPDCCQDCGQQGPVQGHHEDYSKPLSALWLCVSCHAYRHPRKRMYHAA